jgi:hypothetical protein
MSINEYFDVEAVKVKAAALFGFGTPAVNLWLKNLEPLLNTFILLGQIGIAGVTILYIYSKWQKNRKPPRRKRK